jgi:hypothetical protein
VLAVAPWQDRQLMDLWISRSNESGRWPIQETTFAKPPKSSLQWKIQHISYECVYIYNIGFSQLWTCIYFGDFPANHLWWHWSMVSLVAWELIWFPESGLLGRRSQSQIIPGAELQKHQGWSFKNQNHLGHSIYMKVITVDGCEILHQWIGGLSHYL